MITRTRDDAIRAPAAAELANITYRQLDYWARRGWVTPSIEQGTGRPGRRLYSENDVIKLAALGHFGRSGVDVGAIGPRMAALKLPMGDRLNFMIIASDDFSLSVVSTDKLRAFVGAVGAFTAFDPETIVKRLLPQSATISRTRSARRSA